jgi:hypothetical protein
VPEQVWCHQPAKKNGHHAAPLVDVAVKNASRVGPFQHLRTDGWERFAGESLSGCGSGRSITRAQ